MSEVISELDNMKSLSTQLGKNGQTEYTWSQNIHEKMVQLHFQLVRSSDNNNNKLSDKIVEILVDLTNAYKNMNSNEFLTKDAYVSYMSYMYRLIGLTRDIVSGKGEYSLSYMMLGAWLKAFEDYDDEFIELVKYAFKQFLLSDDDSHPYGSWKDLKGLYAYSLKHKDMCDWSILIKYGIKLANEQLRKDMNSELEMGMSLVAKWLPREKSSYNELFAMLAIDFFNGETFMTSAQTEYSEKRALRKCFTMYRKIVSDINKRLDTTQIKQCDRTWAKIDFNNVTSITLHKQKKAFMNHDKKGELRYSSDDRVACANNFTEFIENIKTGQVVAKGARIGMGDFIKEALSLANPELIDLLNAQWHDNRIRNNDCDTLGKMIAMVDTSSSMEGDPLLVAIAMGIRIAEKSLLGKRVMTFNSTPTWINLEDCNGEFVRMVEKVKNASWGCNTNFAKALQMILDAIISNKMNPVDVEDMILVILSDMQIDMADHNSSMSMYDYIENQYKDAGMRVWGKPYKPPHILFWNLRSTDGFPSLSSQKNTSMMSGFSPTLLNSFCEEGMTSLQSCSPWSLFVKSLENERYNCLNKYIRELL